MRAGVIICAYTERRWDLLVRAVESVRAQDVPNHLVLVIDHNDDLLARARDRWPGGPDDPTVIPNRHEQGLSGARNTGVEAVDADAIAFLDDDAAAHDGWLRELVAPLAVDGVGISGGRVRPDWDGEAPGWFPDEFLWVVGCSYVGQPTEEAEIRNPIGASMAVHRDVFRAVGGFHHGVGRVGTLPMGCEETELAIRARTAGFSTRYRPSSVIEHFVSADRHSAKYLLRRCLAEGRSKAIVAALSDNDVALSAERSYVSRTLPAGVLRRSRRALTGPRRSDALAAIAMMAAGVAAAAVGFVQGSWRRSRGADLVVEPVRLELDDPAARPLLSTAP